MAAVLNARDVALALIVPRMQTTATPSNWTTNYDNINGTHRPSNNADVTSSAISAGVTANAGGLILTLTAVIRSGQTAYDTGIGFHLSANGGTPRFSVGNSAGNKITFNGSLLNLVGNLTSTGSIDITGTANFGGANTAAGFTWAVTGNLLGAADGGLYGKGGTSGGAGVQGDSGTSGALIGVNGVGQAASSWGTFGQCGGNGSAGAAGWVTNSAAGSAVGVQAQTAVNTQIALDVITGKFRIGNSVKVANLNADLLDGIDSTGFVILDATSAAQTDFGVVTSGAATATRTNTKPGANSSSVWVKRVIGGTTYYFEGFPA